MSAISAWAAVAADQLIDSASPVYERCLHGLAISVVKTDDSLWIVASREKGDKIAFRTAYSPDHLVLTATEEQDDELHLTLRSAPGSFRVIIAFPRESQPLIHYSVNFTPSAELFIPFWPRDIIVLGRSGKPKSGGEVYIRQTGLRSGMICAGSSSAGTGSFLYLQNFTALNKYFQQTTTSAADTVGGDWPEMGFALPVNPEKALEKNQEYTLSDAYIVFDDHAPADQFELSTKFLNALALIYLFYPKPDSQYHDYLAILDRSIDDLINKKGCWTEYNGHPYLNAYLCDYETPAEIMVQLAVLLPIYDYQEWSGKQLPAATELHDGLAAFYDEKLGTIRRWLPSAEEQLDGSEEQKVAGVMDSWYLHHPLLNLSRMALRGDKTAKKLFLDSIEYAIKVARHFNYRWPVFYQMDTLEVIKAEAKEGEGGEKDVAGLYAHVMLQAWELTGEQRYFREAETAARTLTDYGFEVFYQANNTAFSSGAMLRLYQETKDELFLKLAYLFIANLFKNISLWECTYGYGKHFPRFFSLFPLNDAPYSAVYEEQEGFAAIHDFLKQPGDIEILPSVSLLLAEFVKYAVSRLVYYYPPMLPEEMLSEEVKTGEIDPKAWIALEDIGDGWEKSGSVGQEVYGAGLVFGIAPRHYIRVPEEDFIFFIEYPAADITVKERTLSMKILGSELLSCRLRIIATNSTPLPPFTVSGDGKEKTTFSPLASDKEYIEYLLSGNLKLEIKWNVNQKKQQNGTKAK